MSREAEHGSSDDTSSSMPYHDHTVKDTTHESEQDDVETNKEKTGTKAPDRRSSTKNGTKRVLEGQQDDFNWDDHRSYMSVKKRKLADQFHGMAGEKESMIFQGVTIYVNGWTEPSNDELKRMIHAHGGNYVYNLYGNTKVTHTIASNLPNSKIKTLGDSVVCTPAWIVDSISSGHQLPTDDYLLYKNHGSQKKLSFSKTTSTLPGDQIKKGEQNIETLNNSLLPTNTHTNVHHQETNQHPDSEDGTCNPAGSGSTSSNVKVVEQASATGLPVARVSKAYKASKGAEFVNEFFTHSRLHYLSTWSTELKQFTARMVNRIQPKYPKLDPSQSLRSQHQRAVVHIDLDCFFVSVSIKDKPHLKGKPVAVTHAKAHSSPENATAHGGTAAPSSATSGHSPVKHLQDSTSDIASCSYEARKAGVHNGMSVGKAVKLCPDLELLPYDFDGYRQVSQIFYETLLLYSSTVEAVSCDEAYLELTDYAQDFSRVEAIIGELRGEVEMKTGCTVSAGISHNMLLARLSTRKAKPNGQFYLSVDHAEEFLGSLSVHDLPGVGYSTANKLKEKNVETCGELSALSLAKLQKDFGLKNGTVLYEYSRGIDSRELKVTSERKSVSVDINYGIRFTDISEAESLIKNLADELAKRAKEAEVTGGNVTLKMKIRKPDVPRETWKYLGHGMCDNVSRSTLLLQPTQEAKEICQFAVKLLKQVKVVASDIRGMGLQLSKLVSTQTDSTAAGGSSNEGQNLRKLFQAAASSTPTLTDATHGSHKMAAVTQTVDKTLYSYLQPAPPTKGSSSGYSLPGGGAAVTKPSPVDDSFLIDLPPMSQLDCSVLDALPSAMRNQILRSYEKSLKSEDVQLSKLVEREREELLSLLTSTADASASVQQPEDVLTSISEHDNKIVSDHSTVYKGEAEAACSAERASVQAEQVATSTSTTRDAKILIDNQDEFLKEFRKYLKEWLAASTDGPTESDALKFTDFLTTFAQSNLEMTQIMLRFFRRHILQLESRKWSLYFNALLVEVQAIVKQCSGGILKISELTI